MTAINPYLNFNGTAEEAFNFYKSVFGGEFTAVVRFKDMPDNDRMSTEEMEKIMHISLPVGKGNILMATDALESAGFRLTTGNSFYISVTPDSEEEADRLFNGLSAGGKVAVPMGKASWGDYFGMFTDKFGVQWMVNYAYDQQK